VTADKEPTGFSPASESDGEELFLVEAAHAGQRLDRYLSDLHPDVSRSQIQRSIRLSLVLVDGIVAWKTGIRLKEGEEILFSPPPPEPAYVVPEEIPLDVLYKEEHIIVINKAAGMVVHPAAGHPSGTLVNALAHPFPAFAQSTGLRPGIVHRLDKGTSGVMVVALTDKAREGLSEQFLSRSLCKGYLAINLGEPKADDGAIDAPIGRHPTDRKRCTSRRQEGKGASTRWKKVLGSPAGSLLAVRILTGRTHQIRVHLTDAGFPLLGDDLYGPSSVPGKTPGAILPALSLGPLLHSTVLSMRHPITQAPCTFYAPFPDRFRVALDVLFPGQLATVDSDIRLPGFFPGTACI